ncbi:MAG: GNAT family N-acetyltransferase [Gammaproteobacteria bacterium]|nr:GNAT family N-acetyltransferase [Gammaproteobacteria bacterium]
MTIRDVAAGDLDAIVAIDLGETGVAKHDYWREKFELAARQRATHIFLVAEQEGAVAGFIIGEIKAWEFGSSPCGWVSAIGVANESRFTGTGTRMLEALLAEFKRAGIDIVRTMVARGNRELMSFFRSQGLMAGPYLQLEMRLD